MWAVQNVWQEVLRCVSRWELLQQIASGGPSDALLFAAPAEPVAAVKKRNFFSRAPKDGTCCSTKPTCQKLCHLVCFEESSQRGWTMPWHLDMQALCYLEHDSAVPHLYF